MRRIPQEEVGHRHGNGGGVHERVAATPGRAQVVGDLTDDRIREGVEKQSDGDRAADQLWRRAENVLRQGHARLRLT
jgi:hypothetical protein